MHLSDETEGSISSDERVETRHTREDSSDSASEETHDLDPGFRPQDLTAAEDLSAISLHDSRQPVFQSKSDDSIETELRDRASLKIVGHLTQGGLGALWKAEDQLGRTVVVKTIRDYARKEAVSRQRFRQEMRCAALLAHPSIVSVLQSGVDSRGNDYYVMPMIEGENLHERIAGGSSSQEALLDHFVNACDAIAFAHNHKIIHRDIKPQNIMVGERGETFVIDWGMAKVLSEEEINEDEERVEEEPNKPPRPIGEMIGDDELTQGTQPGTLRFMSPEQITDGNESVEDLKHEFSKPGPKSDIYALGCTLFQILTGRAPFAEHQSQDVPKEILRGRFLRPRQIDPSVDPALEAITLKALSLRPEHRYATATDLRRDIINRLRDRPIEAYPDSRMTKLFRWVKHHRAFAFTATCLLILLTASLLIERHYSEREYDRLVELSARFLETGEEYLVLDDREKALDYAIMSENLHAMVFEKNQSFENHLAWVHAIRRLALMLHKSGAIYDPATQNAEASRHYRQALQQLDRCRDRFGPHDQIEMERASILGDRGMTELFSHLSGTSKEECRANSISTYQRALKILSSLAVESQYKDEPLLLLEQGRLEGNLADAYQYLGADETYKVANLERLNQCENARKRCIEACLQLPDELLEESVLSVQVVRLCEMLSYTKRTVEATVWLRRVLKRYDRIEHHEIRNFYQQLRAMRCFEILAQSEKDSDRASVFVARAVMSLEQAVNVSARDAGVDRDFLRNAFSHALESSSLLHRSDVKELIEKLRDRGDLVNFSD